MVKNLVRFLVTCFAIVSLFLISSTKISAQSCQGSVTCCMSSLSQQCNDCNGDGIIRFPEDRNGTGACVCGMSSTYECTGNALITDSCANKFSNCTAIPNVSNCRYIMSHSCYQYQCTDPGNPVFVGYPYEQCCPNTQTGAQWAAAGGCGNQATEPEGPPGGGPPQSCTPPAAGWTSNRPQFTFAQGGTSSASWDATEGKFFIRTQDDTTDDSDDGKIIVSWTTPGSQITNVDYRFIPTDINGVATADTNGAVGCNNLNAKCDTIGSGTTSITFRPRRNRYYKLRLRFRNGCGSGSWSAWREYVVRIDGQITGRVFVLGAGASAAQTGLNGSCVVTGTATAIPNSTITVTASEPGYTFTDPTLNASNARYRVYLPYLNPGSVTLGLNNVPSTYSVSCPSGGTYNSGNSTIAAPFLSNGLNGTVVNAHFYLCSAGTAVTAPTSANITSPTQNQQVTPYLQAGNYRVNLNFSKPATALVEYRLRPTGTPAGQECTATGSTCGTIADPSGSLTSTTSFIPTVSGYELDIRYTWTACSTTQTTAWSPVRTFTVVGSISGTVYDDPTGTAAGNYCSSGATLSQSSAGQLYTSFVGATLSRTGGNYSLLIPWGAGAAADVLYQDGTTVCGCPGGCTYTGVPKVATGVNFYRTDNSDSWWQAQGGPVLALGDVGVVVQSYIPASCVAPACQPYLIRSSGGAGTSGYILTGQSDDLSSVGQVDLRRDAGIDQLYVDQDGANIIANTNPAVVREVYAEFIRRYKFTSDRLRQDDFDGVSGRPLADGAVEPTHTPLNGGGAYWTGNDVTVDQAWTVSSGETRVILVDGDLTIESPIDVAQGGFLAFIVSGNIIVSPNLGVAAGSTTGVVEGVYIADGTLNFPSRGVAGGGDLKFVGEGTFVGWSGVSMDRDFNDGGAGAANNGTYPTEFFVYRPDFLMNAPDEMSRPRFVWREVAP